MADLGYTMTAEVKLLRRKHLVTFRVGMSKADLVKALECVPDSAEVDEVIDCVDGNANICSIEFHEEKVSDG